MPRERPDEEAVRAELREERADGRAQSAEGRQTADGEEAAPDNGAAPAEAQPTADSGQPTQPEDKAAEYLALAQRTQADFENFRKRAVKDMAVAGARAKAGLIRELLPGVDNLERALGAIEADNGVAQGLKLVYAELEGVLTRNGVQAMEPKGQPFDPTVHEAISTMPAED